MLRDLAEVFVNLIKVGLTMAFVYFPLVVATHFPWTVGPADINPIEEEEQARDFYEVVYTGNESAEDSFYVKMGKLSAHHTGVEELLAAFVDENDLADKRLLEVGAGSGSLQDIVDDYTGLDIAASAARYFHKPFVHGSATDLPFEDNEFDAIITVWTLEHVPNPEVAFEEMRRVVKPGGSLFLFPAWNAKTWAPKGYMVRPYSDFDLWGKAVKASLLVRANPTFQVSWLFPTRMIRHAWWKATDKPTRLHYTPFEPNYTNFWQPDADALASIDNHETMLWYVSRGDACTNCPEGAMGPIWMLYDPLWIRVNK